MTTSALRALRSRDGRFDGLFFYGVTTTGIFCRPSCPAGPANLEHIRLFPTADAALAAGFRCCKRCRPDSAPGAPEWRVGHDVARRAVRLIAEGAMDDEGVSALSRILGYSSRQIRRQLIAEVGAPPIALARSGRANAARTLLETTDLHNAEIAFAAGFRSVRQFHETLRAVYDRTPSQLRTKASVGYEKGGALSLALSYREPMAVSALFSSLADDAALGVATYDGTTYRRGLRLAKGDGWISIARGRPGALACHLHLSDLRDLPVAISRVRRFLDLDCDALAMSDDLSGEGELVPIVRAFPGLRILGSIDPVETICELVLTTPALASPPSPLTPLLDLAGPTEANEDGPKAFVSIDALAACDLFRAPIARPRVAVLARVVAAIALGELDLSVGADPRRAARCLEEIPGTPASVIAGVRQRIFSDPDVWTGPASDSDRVQRTSSPWRSYASAYCDLERRLRCAHDEEVTV
jgi:AraC family transcriptional regulator of adaptative response / DNA-3-methyladenine glycosylase II